MGARRQFVDEDAPVRGDKHLDTKYTNHPEVIDDRPREPQGLFLDLFGNPGRDAGNMEDVLPMFVLENRKSDHGPVIFPYGDDGDFKLERYELFNDKFVVPRHLSAKAIQIVLMMEDGLSLSVVAGSRGFHHHGQA